MAVKRRNLLKYVLIFLLVLGIISFILGYILAVPTHSKPNLFPKFLNIYFTNMNVHFQSLMLSFCSLGIYSFLFVCSHFFLVGVLISGMARETGSFISSCSFFWIHGGIELATVILTASIIPFFFLSIVTLIFKKEIGKKSLLQVLKTLFFLCVISFSLILFAAFLETFIAPKFVIF